MGKLYNSRVDISDFSPLVNKTINRPEYMPSANTIWGEYLERTMFYREPRSRITIKQFCLANPKGVYTIGTGTHAVTVIDGNYYDIWDSGDEKVLYYFERS